MQGHGAEELFAGAFYSGRGEGGGGRVVAHEGEEFGVVGRADVDVGEGVGGVEEFGGGAEVGDGLPDKQRFFGAGVEEFAVPEDGGYEGDAAGGGALGVWGLVRA